MDGDVVNCRRPTGWTGREAADRAGITYRQLDYWARTDLVRPTVIDAVGSGNRRCYSDDDMRILLLIRALLDVGQRLERIRDAISLLRGFAWRDLTSAFVLVTPRCALVAFDPAELVDAVISLDGVVTVLPIASLMSALRPEAAG